MSVLQIPRFTSVGHCTVGEFYVISVSALESVALWELKLIKVMKQWIPMDGMLLGRNTDG